jgi:carbonic anhydrase
MISTKESLERLVQGNERFVAGESTGMATFGPNERESLMIGQKPFAVILGCSDSRVPIELIFDQGFGDLFVIRIAGNIVAQSQIGSIEYAIQELDVKLVLVMGHANCGAVSSAIEAAKGSVDSRAENLGFIVDQIRPALELDAKEEAQKLLDSSIRANARWSVKRLKENSKVINDYLNNRGLGILPAHFSLKTGKVEFLPD